MLEGLEDANWWRDRQDDYLAVATTVVVPTSPLNLIDHVARQRRDPAHVVPWDQVDAAALAVWFARIDNWRDCADFDILRLLTLWIGHRGALPDEVAEQLRERFLGFRYWYMDPVEIDGTDERWYWSENHRLIFHTCELLAGQAFPDERFAATGLTGRQHQARAAGRLAAWFDEKATDGFSEWHSDAYYAKDLAPLVTLAELADDAQLAERAATFADLVLLDLAVHVRRGNVGSTHGRAYMKHKAEAAQQPVFAGLKLCFDATAAPYPLDDGNAADLLPLTESAVLLARAERYRPPAVLRHIATSADELLDEERMGMPIDPSGPVVADPVRPDGRSYDDPELVPFWWDRSALTPWQLIPLTVATLDRHDLWDANLFSLFKLVRDATGGDVGVMQQLAADLHPMVNAGLLEEVHTTTWRNGHAMLSTALAYRPGTVGFQHHAWQATLDEQAVVFTTHPGNPPSALAGDYLDHDRYWTGSATLPYAVQHGRVVIARYEPAFASPTDDLLTPFAYEPETHAWFPQERFDEVRSVGRWTIGRRGGGFVALWSWRPTRWRHHDAEQTYTAGVTGPFDLVAEGGADDVWVCEVGDVGQGWDFDGFCAAIQAAEPEVGDPGWLADGPHPGFTVRYRSPSAGLVESSPAVPLRVEGRDRPIRHVHRMRNRHVEVAWGETVVDVRAGAHTWRLDLGAGTRGPA